MTSNQIALVKGAQRVTLDELRNFDRNLPETTKTYRPVGHAEYVDGVLFELATRSIFPDNMELVVVDKGQRMVGLITLNLPFDGCQFALGVRNSLNKSVVLGMVAGYQVRVCSNMMLGGEFNPLAKKHSASLILADAIAVAISQCHRRFGRIEEQVLALKAAPLSDSEAKTLIYDVFLGDFADNFELPNKVLREVHKHYFEPQYEAFQGRDLWSLSNAFTSAFKILPPLDQYKATTTLAKTLNRITAIDVEKVDGVYQVPANN